MRAISHLVGGSGRIYGNSFFTGVELSILHEIVNFWCVFRLSYSILPI